MRQRALRCLEWLLYAGVAFGGGWLLLRFVLPALAPFLTALLLAAMMEPAVRRLHRLRLSRTASAAFVTLALLGLLLFLSLRLAARGVAALNDLAAALPELITGMENALEAGEHWLMGLADEIPGGEAWLDMAAQTMSGTLSAIPAALSRVMLDAAAAAARKSPDMLLFLVTAGLGSFFVSASFPRVTAWLRAQLPVSWLRQMESLSQPLRQGFGGWLRAQALLEAITFAELLVAFLILRVPNAGIIAALTALVDALPVFGVGAVLVPWAATAFFRGKTGLAVGLLIVFALVSLLRNILQAKLLGDQIGLDPLSSLLAVYAGWKLCGIWGLLAFPLLFVTLRQLHEQGVLRLWRTP